MASVRIPEQYRGGLAKLLKLSNEDAQKVISVIESIPITDNLRETLAERISSVEAIPKSDVHEITEALVSLYMVLIYTNDPPSEFADELVEAIDESEAEELRLPEESRNSAQERLTQFLGIDSIVVSAKAEGIMHEHDNVFSMARVLTDIRPIFGLNAEEPPKAATITHMLSIHYSHGGQHREVHVALDEIDLEVMMDSLERAGKKAESLKSILEMAKLTYIEP